MSRKRKGDKFHIRLLSVTILVFGTNIRAGLKKETDTNFDFDEMKSPKA